MTSENGIYPQRFAFIPHRLEIEGRPELRDFPLNVLYVSYRRIKGVDFSGTALYEPEFETYRVEEKAKKLDYRNIYGPDNLLAITRYEDRWEGVKTINRERVIYATDINWNQFFVKLSQ